MNRSILIVICDFLLLSLLTFSTDLSKMAGEDEGRQPTAKVDVAPKSDAGGKDLAAVMKLALAEEQKNREQLQAELAKAREDLPAAAGAIDTANPATAAETIEPGTAVCRRPGQHPGPEPEIAEHRVAFEEQLALKEAEIKKQADQSAALQQQLAQLNNQLRAADTERRVATGQVALMQQQVEAERAQNARLAEGVKALATNSGALTQEIRENRALAPNEIFNEVVSNRVQTSFTASRTGLFGMDASKSKTTETVLVTDGTRTYALCHVQDTPLTLWDPGTEWAALDGMLSHNQAQVPIHSLSFHLQDPRVVFMPITQAEATQLGCRVYPIASDPYKFQDAVLVGAEEGYYGQCSFQIDLNTPDYVKLDRNLLKGLFGKFNPSRGDLVFSRNGELLGVMANSTYCLMLHKFAAAGTLQFGQASHGQHTASMLSEMFSYVFNLPPKLQ